MLLCLSPFPLISLTQLISYWILDLYLHFLSPSLPLFLLSLSISSSLNFSFYFSPFALDLSLLSFIHFFLPFFLSLRALLATIRRMCITLSHFRLIPFTGFLVWIGGGCVCLSDSGLGHLTSVFYSLISTAKIFITYIHNCNLFLSEHILNTSLIFKNRVQMLKFRLFLP